MEQSKTTFGVKVQERMEALDLTLLNLSDLTAATYEHIRKIVRGDSFPSPYFLKSLCEALSLDFDEMKRVVTADRLKAKYGKTLPELLTAGKDPTLAPVEKVWTKLNPSQKQELITKAKEFANTNRRAS
jgi:transcriptional regulator with XRE-family HTH domain